MKIDDIILILCCLGLVAIMFWYYVKTQKTLKNSMVGMGSGFVSLGIVYFIGPLFNIVISINVFSLLISIILGIPGVVLMVILSFVFNINI